jgi:hypothetical protein
MITKKIRMFLVLLAGLLALQGTVALAATSANGDLSTDRASWLLQRGTWDDYALTGNVFEQGEFGSTDDSFALNPYADDEGGSGSPGWSMLASLVLPGAGEVMMGYRRGYAMMAVDIYAWTQVASYHSEGSDLRDEYYDFADEHYSDETLVLGYQPGAFDPRAGLGDFYFSEIIDGTINDVDDLGNLSLYVTVEDDRREWYENLGKWDQFIFGWDDFARPDSRPDIYTPTGDIDDLRQPWISENRVIYRQMRDDSNDAFKTRDRWLYVNIGMRVFSVLQVAYLSGMLTGGDTYDMQVAGHPVNLLIQPNGMTAGTVAATVDF